MCGCWVPGEPPLHALRSGLSVEGRASPASAAKASGRSSLAHLIWTSVLTAPGHLLVASLSKNAKVLSSERHRGGGQQYAMLEKAPRQNLWPLGNTQGRPFIISYLCCQLAPLSGPSFSVIL